MGKTSTLLGALLLSASGLTLHAQEQLYLTPVTSAEGLVDGQQYVLKYTGPGSPINVLLYEEANHTCANNNGWQGENWDATTILGENPGIIRRQAEGSTETPSLTTDDGQYIFTLEAGQGGTFAIRANSGNYIDGRDLTQVVSGKGVPVHSVNASVNNKSYFTFTWNSSYWNIGNGNSSGRNYLNVGGVDNGCATMWNNAAGTDKGRFQIFSVSDEALSTITLNYRDSKGYTIAPSKTVSVPMGQAYTVPDAPEIAHFTNGTPDHLTIESPGATETVTYTYDWDGVLPFEASTVSGGQWTGDEHWFTLFTRGTYWVYNSGANQIDLKDASLSAPYADEALWCVADAGDGTYKLYNRAAGPDQALTVDGSTVTMGSAGTAMELWYYRQNPDNPNTIPGGWCLNVPDGNNFLNKQNNKLAIWNSTAAHGEIGSVVGFTDVLSDYAALRDEYKATENYVGGYSTEDLTASGLAAATTVDDYSAAFTALNAATPVAIQPGQYYRIVNEQRKVGDGKPVALTGGDDNGHVGRGTASSARNVGQLWQFETSGEGYKLRNANYGLYAGTLDGSGNNNVHMPLVDADAAQTYNLTALGGACWKLADPNNSAHNGVMHCAGNNYIVAWNDGKGSGSSWYIVPVTDIEVAMHSADATATDTWATLYLPFAVETPDGLTAYTGQADTQAGTVALTEIEDGLVPAGNGVVLKGSAEAYTLAIRPDAGARTLPDNDLTGTTTAQPLAEGIYVLGKYQGKPGFYRPNPAQTELSANKAYIDGTPAQALAAGYRFVLGDDETTGIGSVQTPDGPTADQPCYDLQGRRVGQPRQGGVYIQGGKKVYIRK